ncbi:MAG: ornithine carbamoyltransferase [Actinomycetota bacterium]|jgi:ornithine carbamoyltransferase|nr:ornithine carbamoyltransferase [Actinomycetota bacterium]MCL6093772.1 ornithine carbamoyltransferase [Actinomycetota bacterium]MDA8166608.1 ornithine carbamoyltransferase [Actinomycetota bacterium]
MPRHYLKVSDLTREETLALIDAAISHKGERSAALAGKVMGMIFSKPSTRTRASFTVAAYELGGHAMFLSESEMQLGRGETIEDTARILSGYLSGVVIRTFSQRDLEQFAAVATVPVINGLTDERHPCQALSDLMTISEHHEDLAAVKVAYFGDGNNVAVSLINICAMVGAHVVACTPPELAPPDWAVAEARKLAEASGATVEVITDPLEAAQGADFLYTDVWFSMGQQKVPEKKTRLEPYHIDTRLLSLAKPDCKVMHCLPAHRGEEIAADVMDGPQSIVFQQAENRLHAQKELLKLLMGDAKA